MADENNRRPRKSQLGWHVLAGTLVMAVVGAVFQLGPGPGAPSGAISGAVYGFLLGAALGVIADRTRPRE